MNYYPKAYLAVGGFFSLQAAFLILIAVMAGAAPAIMTYMLISMAVLSFSISYLHPQFKQKDERMKLIRYKGLFYSFFSMLGNMNVLLLLLEFRMLSLTAKEVIQILMALNLSTVFLSWVFLA